MFVDWFTTDNPILILITTLTNIADIAIGIATILLVWITYNQSKHTEKELKITQDQMKLSEAELKLAQQQMNLSLRPYITSKEELYFNLVDTPNRNDEQLFQLGIDFINIGQIPAKDVILNYFISQSRNMRHDNYELPEKTGGVFGYEGTLFPQQNKTFLPSFTIRPIDDFWGVKELSLGKESFQTGGQKNPRTYLTILVTYKYGAGNTGKYYKVYGLQKFLKQYSTFSAIKNSRLTLEMVKEDYE